MSIAKSKSPSRASEHSDVEAPRVEPRTSSDEPKDLPSLKAFGVYMASSIRHFKSILSLL